VQASFCCYEVEREARKTRRGRSGLARVDILVDLLKSSRLLPRRRILLERDALLSLGRMLYREKAETLSRSISALCIALLLSLADGPAYRSSRRTRA